MTRPRMTRLAILLLLAVLAPGAAGQTAPADSLPPAAPTDEAYTRVMSLLRGLDRAAAARDSLFGVEVETRDERAMMRITATDRFEGLQGMMADAVGMLPDLEPAPERADSVRQVLGAHLVAHLDRQEEVLKSVFERIEDKWSERSQVAENERVEFETRLDSDLQILDQVLGWLYSTAELAPSVDHDAQPRLQELDVHLKEFAQNLGRRVQVAVQDRENAGTQLTVAKAAQAGEAEVGRLRLNVQVATQRLQADVEAMRRTIRRLEQRSIDASPFRQIVVEATGEISEQLLDPEVLKGLAAVKWRALVTWLETQGPSLVVRALTLLLIVFLFRWTARLLWMVVLVTRVQRSSVLLRDLMGRMLMPTATLLGLLMGLWFLGVDPTTLLASVGVISVILGLALQDSLGNLAAGAFILLYRPYDVDDIVQAGSVIGHVKEMGMANTTIVTFDNRRLFVPNRKIWSEVIENRSMENRRRVDTTVRVVYGQDIETVLGIIGEVLAANDLVLDDPEPLLFVEELAESWVEIAVRPWATTANWWSLYTTLPRLLIETLEAKGIAVPYTRRDVHLHGGTANPAPPPVE